ncbi:hypothetical protein C7H84_35360 [Burkholderia sp. Nafp2/4-1b]|uniref:hypothetical protein n=1 Tax=Burkholderia sp. Nafp2/4-1b TaxID=2116686 RepID=UPI000EF8CDDA|nr:hypothetical protein [Burkholderia sp. Nafp2/4-1b]RKT98743.1 hypothetical protein C7H84_35360 [Burkholderia sp. Nafp2/4-1b]
MTKTIPPDTATPVTFIDTAFRSRVIVFPDGTWAAVVASRLTVSDPAHIGWLDGQLEFRRHTEAER